MNPDGLASEPDPTSARREERMAALRLALRDPEPSVRASAARAIERVESRCDVARLLENLEGGDKLARLNAIHGLGALGDSAGLPALVRALRDPIEDIRAAAVRALGELRAERTLDPLVERLDDPSPLVRRHAIEALGRFGDRRAAGVLRLLLAEPDVEILREVLRALGACHDPTAEPDITRCAQHADAGVRCAAVEALGLLD